MANLFAEENRTIKRISEGDPNAKINIITYESLTCSHCADFHKNVYPNLKTEFIDKGLVKIEFRHFPLDISALNASQCSSLKNIFGAVGSSGTTKASALRCLSGN